MKRRRVIWSWIGLDFFANAALLQNPLKAKDTCNDK